MWVKLCELITDHKFSKLYGYTELLENGKREYYYRCRICKKFYWNYNKPKDLVIKEDDE